MIAVALCTVLLVPLVWMRRQLELQVTMERLAADNARAQTGRALYAAQVQSAQAALNAGKLGTTDQPKSVSLWAALSVNHPVFKAGQTKDLRIEFTLVNDGETVIDPKIPESRIIINGKELSDSGPILSNGLNTAHVKTLSPGNNLQFSVVLGDPFKEQGTYRVSWEGIGFQSEEIEFRVLPDKAQ